MSYVCIFQSIYRALMLGMSLNVRHFTSVQIQHKTFLNCKKCTTEECTTFVLAVLLKFSTQ
jgi:hypothetical protein